jgi:ribosomal protein S18 acetylase RimI-like enzyme
MAPRNERSWSIRPATDADAEEISEILVAAGRVAWGPFLGEARVEEANRGRVHPADLVAVDEEGVLAFVSWNATTGEIDRLYTHPRGWRRGAGRALLERAVEALRAAGLRQAWLVTEERNEGARRFYESVGWRIEGPARVRDWHGVRLREPRYVRDL